VPDNTRELAHQFRDLDQQRQAGTLGMWIFLTSELMFFGGLFLGYTVYRLQYPAEFAAASSRLNLVLGGINTIVLLTSSLTMALAVHFARLDRRSACIGCLTLTAMLGAAFLVVKGFEYRADYDDLLMPGVAFDDAEWSVLGLRPERVRLFLIFYYAMTGVHALHLAIGIGAVAIVASLAAARRFSATHHAPIEIAGLYWHFVDILWIFLLPLLYLIGPRTLSGD
jgi:cytochrome c oxidase subunit III